MCLRLQQLRYVNGGLTMKSTKGQEQNFIVDTRQDREPMKTFQNRSNDKRLKDKLSYIYSLSISVNAEFKCKRNISFSQFQSILTHNNFCLKKDTNDPLCLDEIHESHKCTTKVMNLRTFHLPWNNLNGIQHKDDL